MFRHEGNENALHFRGERAVSDKKTIAIVLGTIVGVAAVATAVGVYVSNHNEPEMRNINDVFEKAKQTVRKLDEAVENLRKSAA